MNKTKLTKQEKKDAIKDIGKIINAISYSIKKDEKEFISEMVSVMKTQSQIISKARKRGLKIEELIPKIKAAYENSELINN
jgi:hypothetical protein